MVIGRKEDTSRDKGKEIGGGIGKITGFLL